ncbi:DJ-1 family glyoxalase III [Thiobaca trueperi]|uniref:4-methyl-5(B-hydroxyethyl)-thiazole monophosphate biosynthesis n=1 Tax=Thiobaca trueperi TaxID=127458 RepID=A0A4R3MZK3_9GAMM|nr:DJ-1 family glyoxalase III [Thiobaca trueperi]TCT20183.1 4-methyl-5(b-hydroxyethyl)-thiazole monophosphate biosynthesis [Thiobaca trueperi]
MPKVLVPLAQGCEELEAVTIIDLLRRAEIEVVTAALTDAPVTASRGTVLLADTTLDAVLDQDFDLIVLPGGLPGAQYLEEDPRLRTMLQRQQSAGRFVAAICAAPKVLASAGLLDGKTATSYPGAIQAADYPQVNFVSAPVVVDGLVVTSRGPGTAMDFALQLIESLLGRARREQVESDLVREV